MIEAMSTPALQVRRATVDDIPKLIALWRQENLPVQDLEGRFKEFQVIENGNGGIAAAVAKGILKQGIMHHCVRKNIDFVLAGSIRDDGPLPEVISDAVAAQKAMRSKIEGVTIALMMGTMLHSIAVGNLLPAQVKTICVDINPSVVTKLTDRGTFQAIGLVTDIEPFLRELTEFLAQN